MAVYQLCFDMHDPSLRTTFHFKEIGSPIALDSQKFELTLIFRHLPILQFSNYHTLPISFLHFIIFINRSGVAHRYHHPRMTISLIKFVLKPMIRTTQAFYQKSSNYSSRN